MIFRGMTLGKSGKLESKKREERMKKRKKIVGILQRHK